MLRKSKRLKKALKAKALNKMQRKSMSKSQEFKK
jgi:hypothetical protein